MAILSYEFALCFALFFIIYWACYRRPHIQNLLLIVASIAFILTWQWLFLASIIFVWLVSQACIYGFSKVKSDNNKKIVLAIGLILLIGHLCFFKYSNFVIEQLNTTVLGSGNGLTPLDIIMPLGVSFYTFQAISYLVDVYQKKMTPMPSAIFFGFLSFIPTLTAGPIFRASEAKEQWLPVASSNSKSPIKLNKPMAMNPSAPYKMSADTHSQWQQSTAQSSLFYRVNISAGLQVGHNTPAISAPISKSTHARRYVIMPYLAMALIAIALFKKLVLAGWLESIWVTPVFANPLQFHGLEVLTAIYAYALQLFFDFSGYTDLVVAIALLLGFRLPENFKQPYLATDIQDFWKKWHITLSTWIKDYLYIPLGGGRRSFWRVQFNLMLAFIISGVWHGAGWNFFIWGAIHGVALVFLNLLKRFNLRFWMTKHAKPVAIFLTFHYVCFGWIFFHSVTFDQALQVIRALGNYDGILFSLPVAPTLAIMAVAWLIYPYLAQARKQIARVLAMLPWWSLPIPIALYVVLIFNLAPEGLPGFIYANF